MNKADYTILKKFYGSLDNQLQVASKRKDRSILVNYFSITSNSAHRILLNSSIKSYGINNRILRNLIDKGYIKSLEIRNQYVITPLGIWEIEKIDKIINEYSLIESISNKYFNFFNRDVSLSDKEKLILFTLISMRCFSTGSSVDLKRNQRSLDKLKVVIEKNYTFLKSFKILKKLKADEIFGAKSNEHPVSNLIRHSDNLPKRSKSIYRVQQPQKYFLELSSNEGIDTEDLAYILWLVFRKSITSTNYTEILNYLNTIVYDMAKYIFDINEHKFLKPEYDYLLNDSITEYFRNISKWESEISN